MQGELRLPSGSNQDRGQQLDSWEHSCKIKPPWAEALAQRMQPRALQGDKTATDSRHQPGHDSPDPSATAGGAPCPGQGTAQGPSSPSSLSRCAHSHVFREKWRFSAAGAAAARAEGSAWPSRYWMERSWKQGSASITAVARSALQRDITVRLCPLPTPSSPHRPGQAPGCVPRPSAASWVLQELRLALGAIAAVKWEPQGAPALRSPQRLCPWGQSWGTAGHTQGPVLLLARSKAAEGHPSPPPPLPAPCSGSLQGSIGCISTC